MIKEFKTFEFCQKNHGESEDGEHWMVEGIFSTPDVDFGQDIVPMFAVKNSIEAHGIPSFRHQHDGNQAPVGRIMEIVYDGEKSIMKALIPKGPVGDEYYKHIKLGSYKGLSIGYMVNHNKVVWEKDVRILNEINIFEISLVDSPMNGHTDIQAKKKKQTNNERNMEIQDAVTLSDVEEFLGSNLSRTDKKTLISKVYEIKQRDAEAKTQRDAEAETKRLSEKADLKAELKVELEQEAKALKDTAEAEAETKRLADEADELKSKAEREDEFKVYLEEIENLKSTKED